MRAPARSRPSLRASRRTARPTRHCLNQHTKMSAIFNFSSLVVVLLLFVCTTAYLRALRPTIFDGHLTAEDLADPQSHRRRTGVRGFCWRASRVGERASPYVAVSLAAMAVHIMVA